MLTQLSALPAIDIRRLDAYTLLQHMVANPSLYALRKLRDACVTPNVEPFFCQTPDEYLFWDDIHPTRAAHAVVAGAAAAAAAR